MCLGDGSTSTSLFLARPIFSSNWVRSAISASDALSPKRIGTLSNWLSLTTKLLAYKIKRICWLIAMKWLDWLTVLTHYVPEALHCSDCRNVWKPGHLFSHYSRRRLRCDAIYRCMWCWRRHAYDWQNPTTESMPARCLQWCWLHFRHQRQLRSVSHFVVSLQWRLPNWKYKNKDERLILSQNCRIKSRW